MRSNVKGLHVVAIDYASNWLVSVVLAVGLHRSLPVESLYSRVGKVASVWDKRSYILLDLQSLC